jgi:hypothetical protein
MGERVPALSSPAILRLRARRPLRPLFRDVYLCLRVRVSDSIVPPLPAVAHHPIGVIERGLSAGKLRPQTG